ncbi:MAG: hypothetical protein LBL69_01500 [Zoogloeaceae bacterium]|jgi:hypothetical protein|nr:hypothetical protein [Zoogloeaceae bacterium]
MITPAQRHRQRIEAQEAAKAAPALDAPTGTPYELMLANLDADKRRLKAIQSVAQKNAVKRELLHDYTGWIDGVLAADGGQQDDVLMHVLVWRIDAGDYDGALTLARYALRHHLALPGQYNRTLGTLLADEFADAALDALKNDEAEGPAPEVLLSIDELTKAEDMPDEARAKLKKAIGLTVQYWDAPMGLTYLKAALALHSGVGVKKDIERMERQLKNP